MGSQSSRRGLKPRTRSKPAPGKRKRAINGPRGSSDYYGLSRLDNGFRSGHFRAQQTLGGQLYRAGIWPTERDAAIAVDRVRLYLGLDPVNLPNQATLAGPASPEELRQRASEKCQQQGSRFKGVLPGVRRKRWRAVVWVDGEMVSLGAYDRDDDAALAYDRGALYFSREAALNIPDAGTEPWSPEALRAWSERLRSNPNEYSGVEKDTETGRWRASAVVQRGKSFKLLDVGTWDTPVEAARARDRAVLHYVGDHADLNLPKERRKLAPANAARLKREARLQETQSMSKARIWHNGTHQYVCYGGKTMTLSGWAAELGISPQGIRERIASGLSLEAAVSRAPRARVEPKLYGYKGRSLTLSEWARKLGLRRALLYARIHTLGWSFSKAASTPVTARKTNK